MADSVIGVGDPVSCWGNVDIEGGTGWFYEHSQIVTYVISSLDTILHEISISCMKVIIKFSNREVVSHHDHELLWR